MGSQKSGVRGQESEVRSQESGVRSQQLKLKTHQLETNTPPSKLRRFHENISTTQNSLRETFLPSYLLNFTVVIVFTGLIQALGIIKPLANYRFGISCQGADYETILSDLAIGDSVAVDGICLTVEKILPQGFEADASPETLRRTTLGESSATAAYVNLETSVRVGSKLGGHFVTGHVDGIGCLQESVQTANSWEMYFTAPEAFAQEWQRQIARYIVPKGSIAINGVSLTVADCDRAGSWFKVAVIPHTFKQTNLCHLQAGSWVNLEGDILGKYVEKLLGDRARTDTSNDVITSAFLAEHGYL